MRGRSGTSGRPGRPDYDSLLTAYEQPPIPGLVKSVIGCIPPGFMIATGNPMKLSSMYQLHNMFAHCGRRAASQPAASRAMLNVQILSPLLPADAWMASA